MPQLLAWLQAPPELEMTPTLLVANAIAWFVALSVLAASMLGWSMGLARLTRGEPLLPYSPRRSVPWSLIDLVAAICLFIAGALVAGLLLSATGLLVRPAAGQPLEMGSGWLLLADAAAKFFALAAILLLIRFRQPLTWRDLGFSRETLLVDLALGGLAFAMLAPLVLGIQVVLVKFWPSSHPLIEMLQKSPSPAMFALTCFSAVIVAPLTEELAFRVLLQGWLEKAFSGQDSAESVIFGGSPNAPAILTADLVTEPAAPPLPPPDLQNPYAPPQAFGDPPPAPAGEHDRPGRLWFLPILISSVTFALMHWSHGPDWVPLTMLAMGLGYLYQRTHRAMPSIVVHFLLNGLSMTAVAVQVFLMPAK